MEMVGQTKINFLVLLFVSIVLTFYTMIIVFLKMIKFYKNDKKFRWIVGILYCLIIFLLFLIVLFHLFSVTKLSLKDNITTNYQVFYRFLFYFCIAQLIHNEYVKEFILD